MTEKDIMIGDWFRFRYTTTSNREVVHTFRISQIENQLKQYYVWGEGFGRMCHPENLEPIPLTQEILEKNFNKKTFYGIFDDYFDFDIREYSDDVYIATYHCCEMGLPNQCIILSFVDELQHFLNHCGISKEIVL